MSVRTEEQNRLVRYRRVSKLTRKYWAKVVITTFICWHITAIGVWTMPQLMTDFPMLGTWSRTYLTMSGFNQGWTMFSPNPFAEDVWVECSIHYADGSVKNVHLPRMQEYSIAERYGKERWRKYAEVISSGGYRFLNPTLARWEARRNDSNPNNPPRSVDVYVHEHILPAIDAPHDNPWLLIKQGAYPITREDLK